MNFENEFGNEMEGVELSIAIQKTKNCKHEFEVKIVDDLTQDCRKIKKKITTCKFCGYYKVEVLEEEPVSDDALWS